MDRFQWYQVVGIVVSLFYMAHTARRFFQKEARLSVIKLFAALIIWGTVLLFSLFGLGDDVTVLIFLAFIIVFIFMFRLLNIIEKLEKNITEIVRQDALKKIKK